MCYSDLMFSDKKQTKRERVFYALVCAAAVFHCSAITVAAIPWTAQDSVSRFAKNTIGQFTHPYTEATGVFQQWYFYAKPPFEAEERYALYGLDQDGARKEISVFNQEDSVRMRDEHHADHAKQVCLENSDIKQVAVIRRDFQMFESRFNTDENADLPSRYHYENVVFTENCSRLAS